MTDRVQRLAEVIDEHLPPGHPKTEIAARDLERASAGHMLGVFDPDQQITALKAADQAARDLAAALAAIHPDVAYAWFVEGCDARPAHLAAAVHEFRKHLPFAKKLAAHGEKAWTRSDVNLRGAAIADECRLLWRLRTREEAPQLIATSDGTPFAQFLTDVLKALDAGTAVSAMRLLKRLHS